MIRDFQTLAAEHFDVLVVGGGVLGACVARDAALRGLRTALIERDDFAAGASGNNLKIIHGGLRYLQRLDLRRVRESIMERAAWLRTAPHLVQPLPVIVPCYRGSLQRPLLLRLAAAAANAIGWGQDRGLPPERRVAHAAQLSRAETIARIPELDRPDLVGALLFHDAVMYSSERLVLEVVIAASEAGAAVVNHAECQRPLHAGSNAPVRVRDRLTGESIDVRASTIVNATGQGAAGLIGAPPRRTSTAAAIPHALALNLVLRGPARDAAFALSPRRQGSATRKLFVVPWRGRIMIGTAHYHHEGPADPGRVPEPLVEQFLAEVNGTWQGRGFSRDDVTLVHRGLLPMPAVHRGEPALLDRHRIIDHASEGIPGLITAFSAKYTTARLAAQDVVDLVFRKLGHEPPRSRTAEVLLPGAPSAPVPQLLASARARFGGEVDGEILEHLVRTYGTRTERVLASRSTPHWLERVDPARPVIRAQFAYGVQQEMAMRPDDLIRRRTELGAVGAPAAATSALAQLAFSPPTTVA